MKHSLGLKMFIAFLGIGLLVALAIAGATRISFLRGFSRYAENQDTARMESIALALSDAYKEQDGWVFLTQSPRTWRRFIGASTEALEERPAGNGPRLRMALVDAQGQLVAGRLPEHEGRRVAVILDGQPIGWLVAGGPGQRPSGDLAFLDEQFRNGWRIAGAAIALAALVAFLLSRRMLFPIRAMAEATHRLASGHYETRIPVSSHDEIGRLAGDFNQLAVALERNEQMRRSYMADISHDLRTPLAILRGELEAMEDGIKPASPENVRALQGEVITLMRLVEDLHALALSDIGALSYRKTPTDILPLLRKALSAFSIRMEGAGIALETSLPENSRAMTQGDSIRLTQLFNNLLENTLRHTDTGGQASVSCRLASNALLLDFEDTAPAPAPEDLPNMFSPQAQGHKGLGLAICRKIVEAHGGTIEATPSMMGGLHIHISLPLQMGEGT
ncbi:MAG TPA: sensor histidine kinase efflux regulator BaeS [Rhodospirillaceae bacterium]|nr:MAG: hypothetical protein A2018_04825 [Alphaproteobacteria bacterium GWF2_58_20]HAU28841.1 sensor histidine kinase efflux regulator BaeS [Rhodospirillaceae bacterium]